MKWVKEKIFQYRDLRYVKGHGGETATVEQVQVVFADDREKIIADQLQ